MYHAVNYTRGAGPDISGTIVELVVVSPVKLLRCDGSASFLAELSVRSPRKLVIFIIYKNIFWIKVSKKYFNLILKKEALCDGLSLRNEQ